jgi:hypothetical protein
VNNNFFLKGTIIPVTIATLILPFGWFYYYFPDIGSLLDPLSDLVDNPVEANIDRPSAAMGRDGEDGEDGKVGISIGDGQGAAIASGGNGGNGGNGGTAITSGSPGSTATANGGNGGHGGNGGNGGTAINMPRQ